MSTIFRNCLRIVKAGRCVRPCYRHSFSTKADHSLRILFCGSDDFSITSLRAIDQERQSGNGLIESIDVLFRPGKPTGRGLKTIRDVPIKGVAEELGLAQHAVDSFKEWTLPSHINLVIAVSFGLLIPAQIIHKSTFGGLNVHPSLLPDLRGAAPIHHTLLNERRYTGVSVQTLHPTKFDHGVILAQTPFPGIQVPQDSTPESLQSMLASVGAELLLDTLKNQRFIGPLNPVKPLTAEKLKMLTGGRGIQSAPKITKDMKRLDWQSRTGPDMLLQNRVFGDLWDTATFARLRQKARHSFPAITDDSKRVLFHNLIEMKDHQGQAGQKPDVEIIDDTLVFHTIDGSAVGCKACTLEGCKTGTGVKELQKLTRAWAKTNTKS